MGTPEAAWYIVKQPSGVCDIVAAEELTGEPATDISANPENSQHWGPFTSRNEAIARRVGLIRAGKCQPI